MKIACAAFYFIEKFDSSLWTRPRFSELFFGSAIERERIVYLIESGNGRIRTERSNWRV